MHKSRLLAGVAAAAFANTEGVRYRSTRQEDANNLMVDLGPSELDKKRIAAAKAKRERKAKKQAEIMARNRDK